jgi:DNA-binding IclR family transcriptional regulator
LCREPSFAAKAAPTHHHSGTVAGTVSVEMQS